MFNKFWCNVFGIGTQPFDFIKSTKIQNLADAIKGISQTSTVQQWIPGIMINMLNKSELKNPAN